VEVSSTGNILPESAGLADLVPGIISNYGVNWTKMPLSCSKGLRSPSNLRLAVGNQVVERGFAHHHYALGGATVEVPKCGYTSPPFSSQRRQSGVSSRSAAAS